MTYQIIYSSVSSTPMQLDDLDDILEQAQDNNPGNGITGALVYADGYFLQVLEGERDAVEGLLRTISKDLRHEKITVLHACEIPSATFSKWTMAYVSATPEQVAKWAGLSGTTKLPEVWEDVRQDRNKVAQVARGILSVLVGSPPSKSQAP